MSTCCPHGKPWGIDGRGCWQCISEAQAGRAARDRAIAAAEARRGAGWDRKVIDSAIRQHAATGRPFSAATIRPLLPKVSGSLIGAAFLRASRSGEIEAIGTGHTGHAAGHSRKVTLWRGTSPQRIRRIPGDHPSAHTSPTEQEFYAATERSEPSSTTPASETSWAKARRLVSSGRVRIYEADSEGRVVAHVKGDAGRYTVRRTAGGRVSCTCPAGQYGGSCSHKLAVQLVTEHAEAS